MRDLKQYGDIKRGIPGTTFADGEIPSQQWFNPEIIASAPERYARAPGRMFLGLVDGRVEGKGEKNPVDGAPDHYINGGYPVWYETQKHRILIAGSRGGKGISAVDITAATWSGSMLAIDVKGEITRQTSEARKAMGQDIRILDPYGMIGGQTACFNPLTMIDVGSDDAVDIADSIAESLIFSKDDIKDHWLLSAQNLLLSLILYTLCINRNDINTPSLYDVYQQLLVENYHSGNDELFNNIAKISEDEEINTSVRLTIRMYMLGVLDAGGDEKASIISSLRQQISVLTSGNMKECVKGNHNQSLDFTDFKKKGLTVYVVIPSHRLDRGKSWLRLIINMALLAQVKAHRPPASGAQTLFLIDEFPTLGYMKEIEISIGLVAGSPYNIKFFIILQALSQLERLYQKSWDVFFANAGIIQFFANTDLRTLEYISNRCGETVLKVKSSNDKSSRQKQDGGSGETWRYEKHPLISHQEIIGILAHNDLNRRQIFFLDQLSKPLLLQRAFYHRRKDDLFAPE